MRAVPAVGNTKPMSSFNVVVFPAPLGPRKPKISPSSTVRCNGFKACFGFLRQKPTVYVFSNPRISIAAMRDSDGSRTKLYSKFKAIESGRAVTEVTKGSCCGRRDRWRQLSAIRGTETCSTRLKVCFRLRPVPVAHTQRRGPLAATGSGTHRREMDFTDYSGRHGRSPA